MFRRLQNALPAWAIAVLVLALTAAAPACAEGEVEQTWGITGQATYIW